MSFKDVAFQPGVTALLRSSIDKNHLPHALLFLGPEGSGRRAVSRELTKALFCKTPENGDSCGECPTCRRVGAGTHPDYIVLGTEDDSRVIKVEAVRQLIAKASMKPFEAPLSVFVIEKAEAMNDIAQNALLKTLEEPPGRALIILIAPSAETLLATIRSRVQTMNFVPVKSDKAVDPEIEKLKRQVVDYLHLVESSGRGSSALRPPDLSKLDRGEIAGIMEELIAYFRDALMMASGAPDLAFSDEEAVMKKKLAAAVPVDDLRARIELFAEVKEKILNSINVKLALSYLWEGFGSAHAR
jgi:DNA polymerase-3 subunit delta'